MPFPSSPFPRFLDAHGYLVDGVERPSVRV